MEDTYSSDQLEAVKKWLGTGSVNIFGLPFAGKDTQAKQLAQLFNAKILGGGDVLRGTDVPLSVTEAIDRGELAPTGDFMNIIIPYLSQPKFNDKPLLLSSVGRWHGEEPGVITATINAKHPIKAVIFLNMPEEYVWQRWESEQKLKARGPRVDDALNRIDTRLQEFRHKTLAVIDFYRDKNLLIEIDGSSNPEVVTNEIIKQLSKRALSA